MSSHSNPHHYVPQGHIYYENSSGPPVSRQSYSPEQSWTPSTPTGDRGGHSQPYHSDPVRDQLEAHDVEDTTYSINHPQTNILLQVPGVRPDATYTNDDIPFQPSIFLPYDHYSALDYGQFQNQSVHAPYELTYHPQSYVPTAQTNSNFALDFPIPQASQSPSVPHYPHLASTQHLSLDHGGPVTVYQTNPDAPPIPANFSQNGFTTAMPEVPNANAGQHSHSFPVVTSSSNQSSVPGPSRLHPSSPERRRLLPLTADEHYTARRVVPRSDRAWSGHSTDSHIPGRGRVIPQERYTSNSITSYNTPASHPPITFNLGNPNQTGIPITDILNQSDSFTRRLRDRTEAFNMDKKTFTLRILWPGYEPWTKTISAMDWKKTRGPIKRVKLAEVVARAVRDLIQEKQNEPCGPDHAEWRVGQGGIQLEQICLVALFQVSRGSLQPHLCLIDPPQ